MDKEAVFLQVFFQEPFWVGILERTCGGKLEVCKLTFGAEPKDYEVWKMILGTFYGLRFSPAVEAAVKERPSNPKRMQREAGKQVENAGLGTKSQQALQLQHEQAKIQRKIKNRRQKEEEARRLFELKQQKRREKHKGR